MYEEWVKRTALPRVARKRCQHQNKQTKTNEGSTKQTKQKEKGIANNNTVWKGCDDSSGNRIRDVRRARLHPQDTVAATARPSPQQPHVSKENAEQEP